MATIKDVAQAAQVSTAAVSRVLNKDDNISVSPEVRARRDRKVACGNR